jgi:hypothetical protein
MTSFQEQGLPIVPMFVIISGSCLISSVQSSSS